MAISRRRSGGRSGGGSSADFTEFWGDCPPGVVAAVASQVSGTRELVAGEDLFRANEPCPAIFGLLRGWMFLYQTFEDGRRQIFHFALPGAVLGFSPMSGAIMTYSAQALTDAAVWSVSRDAFEELCKAHPELGMRLASLISRDYSLAFDHLSNIGRRSARERVARLLLELFIRGRMRWPGHRVEELSLPLTQEHIGDATGLSGVHVNRVVRGLQRHGILEFHYRRLRILDPDKLVDVAGIDPRLALSWIGRN